MREFTVKRGKFQGPHKIYDNAKELYEGEGVSFIRKPWSHPDAKIGEWCYLDDGFIAQLLFRNILTSKRTGNVVDTYRFCFGSRAAYFRKNGDRAAQACYSTNPSTNKSALVTQGYDRSIGGSYDARKKLWVNYVANGMDPFEATTIVYANFSHKKGKTISVTNKLIENTKIQEYLMEALVPFRLELSERIAKATNGGTLNEIIAEEVVKVAGMDSKNIKDATAKVKLLLDIAKITGDIVDNSSSRSKITNATEAHFSEVQPPTLGIPK